MNFRKVLFWVMASTSCFNWLPWRFLYPLAYNICYDHEYMHLFLGSFNETFSVLFTFNEKTYFYFFLVLFTTPLFVIFH